MPEIKNCPFMETLVCYNEKRKLQTYICCNKQRDEESEKTNDHFTLNFEKVFFSPLLF